jgi:beta-ribofuranosylaminobenzene 5'-phosphate synthase
MSVPVVEVHAPSRLHFGMFSFGQPGVRQFGGVGAMVGQGTLRLRIEPAERFVAQGRLAERVHSTAERFAQARGFTDLPACRVQVVAAPDEHVGLGLGTQMALSVAAGLNAFFDGEPLDAEALAVLSGRGARSAIGTYGFKLGGLLVERGKLADEVLSPLECHLDLPPAWRFAIVCPGNQRGLSGEDEQRAFRDLPPVPRVTTERLWQEVRDELLPAARAADFERFGESLYRFGYAAGLCFAARQGGPFAGSKIENLVAVIRELGVRGVGQTSWGPTVFALLEDQAAADRFQARMESRLPVGQEIAIVAPNNEGASIVRIGG